MDKKWYNGDIVVNRLGVPMTVQSIQTNIDNFDPIYIFDMIYYKCVWVSDGNLQEVYYLGHELQSLAEYRNKKIDTIIGKQNGLDAI